MEIIPVCTKKPVVSGGMYRIIRNGPKGAELARKSLLLPSERGRDCPKFTACPCRATGTITKKSHYIQPARPKSYAPVRTYHRPEQPIESGTIYRKSYLPVDADRPDLIIPQNNLGLSNARFAKDTIHKMSYPGWYNNTPRSLIIPCRHDLLGKGPLSNVTTQRHDYVPKEVDKAIPIRPINNLFVADSPLSDLTTHRMSYLPNEGCKRDLIIPRESMDWPSGPLESTTIHKMSYQPVKMPEKEFLPWAQKKPYTAPCEKMDAETIYRKSYLPSGGERAQLIVPKTNKNILGDGRTFDDNTIYHLSYLGTEGAHRPDLIIPPNNIYLSQQKMDGNTVHKMSYQANALHNPPAPFRPCSHDLLGKGPISQVTTNRHDYVPKYVDRVDPIRPERQIFMSNAPLSDLTTNRMSYLPNGGVEMVAKILPKNNIERATGRMENNTIHKMSYQPVPTMEKMATPWADKMKYCPPTDRFADDTVYRMSYDAPGEWLDGGDGACQCPPDGNCPCTCPTPIPVIG